MMADLENGMDELRRNEGGMKEVDDTEVDDTQVNI